MTEVFIDYIEGESESLSCNYVKLREGWLEIALTQHAPHEKIFIPAHCIKRVNTKSSEKDTDVNEIRERRYK